MKEKLQKIQRLLNSSIQGEREAAQAMLEKFMKKHNLSEQDLIEENTQYYKFCFFHKYEKALLFQIYAKILNKSRIKYLKGYRFVKFKLTEEQANEFKREYKLYRLAMKKEMAEIMETAQSAFFSKHNLFPVTIEKSKENNSSLNYKLFSELYRKMKTINPYFNKKPDHTKIKLGKEVTNER